MTNVTIDSTHPSVIAVRHTSLFPHAQRDILCHVDDATVSMEWTNAFVEDVSPMDFFFAVGSVDQRGRWDIQDWFGRPCLLLVTPGPQVME